MNRPRALALGAHDHALMTVDLARRNALNTIFDGTQLQHHHLRSALFAKDIAKQTSRAQKATASAASAVVAPIEQMVRDQLKRAVTQLFDVNTLLELADFIEESIVGAAIEAIADIMPYLGLAKNAAKTVIGAIKTADSGITRYRVGAAKAGYLPGDPQAAVDALKTLVNREIAFNAATTTREFLATSAKTAGIAASFGGDVLAPVVGAANAVSGLILSLTAAALEYRDMKNGNAALRGDLDSSIFGECPILACYFLTCTSTSDVLNFLVGDITTPGFMDRVEALRRTIEPARNKAAGAIAKSRYVLFRGGVEIHPMARATTFGPKIHTKDTGTQGMRPDQYAKMMASKTATKAMDAGIDMVNLQVSRFHHHFGNLVKGSMPLPP